MVNFTERIGVNHIGEIAERNQWMFREQPIDDVGIDEIGRASCRERVSMFV